MKSKSFFASIVVITILSILLNEAIADLESFLIFEANGVQQHASISGDIVVWTDRRNMDIGDIYGKKSEHWSRI